MNKIIDVKELLKSGHSVEDILEMMRPEVELMLNQIKEEELAAMAAEKSKDATDLGKMFATYARKWHQNELVAKAFESENVEEELDSILGRFKAIDSDMRSIMKFLDKMGL